MIQILRTVLEFQGVKYTCKGARKEYCLTKIQSKNNIKYTNTAILSFSQNYVTRDKIIDKNLRSYWYVIFVYILRQMNGRINY